MASNFILRQHEGKIIESPAEIPAGLGPKEILIRITHSGVCGTDFAMARYGPALGHEGVGIVEKIGSEVTLLKVGDRAGGGYQRDSCGYCNYCITGREIWCYERNIFGEKETGKGTFGKYYVGIETFVHKIPDCMSSEVAAPLQCAGATTYTALLHTVRPTMRVGIVGVGGLGHLAIQYASKLGAEVVVFSYSAGKEAEARAFGASEFYLVGEAEKVSKPIEVLVLAGKGHPDLTKFFTKEGLARNGTLVPLSEPPDFVKLPGFQQFFNGYNLHASLVANRKDHDDMLAFSAKHDIKPLVETFDMSADGLIAAFAKLQSGKLRYRAVLVAKE